MGNRNRKTYMPNINPQEKALPLLPRTLVLHATQLSHSNHIVQPVVILIARLEQHTQLQAAFRLRRARRLQQDVRAVVRAEIVPSICAEDAGLRVGETPIGSEVKDLACEEVSVLFKYFYTPLVEGSFYEGQGMETSESGTGEVATDDGNGFADSARALGFVEAVFAFGEGCVEESEAWGFGLGDCWDGSVLGAAEEGERGEGQDFLEIHG